MNPSELWSKSYFSLKNNDLLGLSSFSIIIFNLLGFSMQLLSKEIKPDGNCRLGKKNELPINY